MLSIVNMDVDSDVEIIDEHDIKSETIDIEDEPIDAMASLNVLNTVVNNLELIPVVYTTRLDEMTVLKSYPVHSTVREVTNRIIKESRPSMLRTPFARSTQRNKRRFANLKLRLDKIYSSSKIYGYDETDLQPNICNIQIASVKSEVLDEPRSKNINNESTCKYSELLKLCKPCSVIIPVMSQPFEHVIHGGQVLKTNKAIKPILASLLRESSSDEEQPLITLYPELIATRNITEETSIIPNEAEVSRELEKIPKRQIKIEKGRWKTTENNEAGVTVIPQRTIRNGLIEIRDAYSKECNVYYTDHNSNLLDYLKTSPRNASSLESATPSYGDCKYEINNCCWVKRDEAIQALYPKAVIYPNSRFMRKPHPCKPGACVCCCRKKENVTKPTLVFSAQPSTSANRKSFNKEDMEIQDLEDEIDMSIIKINKSAERNPSDWLKQLLSRNINSNRSVHEVPRSLIAMAMAYKKPRPKKTTDNRHVVTLKKSQNTVLILRNFSSGVTEIYEMNEDGNIETFIKTTCYNNTSQPDVKRLLKKPNAINESVCCWFKRETVINILLGDKTLHPAAVKFVKTSHACQTNECTCCCKPKLRREINLKNIQLPLWRGPLIWVPSKSQQADSHQPLLGSTSTTQKIPQINPSKTKTSQNDDDCQITSVMSSPSLRPLSQTTTVPTAPAVPTVPAVAGTNIVDSDELSQEVNSLISSILERFKDVRLTINSDGKVAAALNTPVNTLSTVELKVLANILSYAQSQVNLIGSSVNSGMSLSNVINLKVDDVQNATLDPNSVYKAFGGNVNLNQKPSEAPVQTTNANIAPAPLVFPQASVLPTPAETNNFFSNLTSVRNQHFNEAFSSFISTKIDRNPEVPAEPESITPVIESVFSLKAEPEETDSTSTTFWYQKPTPQASIPTVSGNTVSTNPNQIKRKVEMETPTSNTKKIRLVSPSNFGAVTNEATVIAAPMQESIIPGVIPGVPVLTNDNLQIIGQTLTPVNSIPPNVSHPILILNPLNKYTPMNTGGTVRVPFTNNSLNVQNVMSISKIPLFVNPTNASHSVNTGNKGIPFVQGVVDPIVQDIVDPIVQDIVDPIANVVPEATDYCVENFPVEEDCVINNSDVDDSADNDPEMEYCEDNIEFENCENNEEEDCILGF